MPNRLGTSIIAGLALGLASLPPSMLFFARTEGMGWGLMVGLAPLSAFLMGCFFWWLLVSRGNRATPGRGAAAGFVASLLAHPLAWLLLYFCAAAGVRTSSDTLPQTGLLPTLAALALASWLGAGWVLVPLGAAVGAFLGRLQSRAVER
jgi:hypothetical protein